MSDREFIDPLDLEDLNGLLRSLDVTGERPSIARLGLAHLDQAFEPGVLECVLRSVIPDLIQKSLEYET